jgi:hypothetical protein
MVLLFAATLLPGAVASCGPDAPATIDRQTFVDVFVELRIAALDAPQARLPQEARERILASHGVTADDLLGFAEVHARDPAYMRSVWDEIEERMNVQAPESAESS